MAQQGHGYLDWAGVQLIMGGTLPSPCTAFSQSLSVNLFRWRIRGERANLYFSRPYRRMRMQNALLFNCQRIEYAYWGHQTVEQWRGGSSSIACTWCHGGHVGGEQKKHFSPLATLFSCKFFKKKLFCIDLQHGRLTTWLQTKKIALELTNDRRLKDKSLYQRRTNLGFY